MFTHEEIKHDKTKADHKHIQSYLGKKEAQDEENNFSALKKEIEARKAALEAQMLELQAKTKISVNRSMSQVRAQLIQLKHLLKDGWEDMSEGTKRKLQIWLGNNS